MPLWKPVGVGSTAEIYDWKKGHIVKLFPEGWPAAWVQLEAENTRRVREAGLPVPIVGEVVKINNRIGLVYERMVGPSMLEYVRSHPWTLVECARLLAQLHFTVHRLVIQELPSQKEQLKKGILAAEALLPDRGKAVLSALQIMPEHDNVCHGDFDPSNIIMTAEGPVIVDWFLAGRGDPLSDVAGTSLHLGLTTRQPTMPARCLLNPARRWFRTTYLKSYSELSTYDEVQLTAWQAIVAAARLKREEEEKDWEKMNRLLALVRTWSSFQQADRSLR